MPRFATNFSTCHSHPKSLDSGSTPAAFVKREIELGTGTVTVTDHGSLAATREIYELAHADKIDGVSKPKLIPILGLEGYFRDDDCPILTKAGYAKNASGAFTTAPKYQHFCVHFMDQAAYECGVRLLSRADARLESTLTKLEPSDRKHGKERKPLFIWSDLEELGSHNVTLTTGCLIGVVQRHVLDNDDLATAEAYYERLRSLVKPGNFIAEIFPHDCSKNWVEGVFIQVMTEDGQVTTQQWKAAKKLRTDVGELPALELAKAWKNKNNEHTTVLAVKHYHKWHDLPPGKILSVDYREEYIQNECTWFAPDGDVQAGLNKVVKGFAEKYGDRILIADDSHLATPEDRIVQDVRLAQSGSWRFYGDYSRQTSDQAFDYFHAKLGVSEKEFEGWIQNSVDWASQFKDFKWEVKPELPTKFFKEKYELHAWSKNPKIAERDHTLMYLMELIKKHGRMEWNNPKYQKRLKEEIELFHNNGTIDLLPYFFLGEEVCDVYEKAGEISGPGRGSAAGVLISYLIGITHVDPLVYDLSLDRFLTLDRIKSGKMPDIDQDLPGREILTDPTTGWLHRRFGNHFAQISVDVSLHLRSAVQDVARFRAKGPVPYEIVELTKKFQKPPQGIDDYDFVMGYDTDDEVHVFGSLEPNHEGFDPALAAYTERYPEDWEIVKKCLGLSRSKGRHASAFLIANRPIHDFIPMTTISRIPVTAYTANSVEAVGGLKMDFLVVNSLNDLRDVIQMAQQRHADKVDVGQYKLIEHEEDLVGWSGPRFTKKRFSLMIGGRRVPCQRLVPLNGKFHDIWDLPADNKVFENIALGRNETVFQLDTGGVAKWMTNFAEKDRQGRYGIRSIDSMAAFTALDRPGPLDMYVTNPEDGTKHNMLVEYARRARGALPSEDVLKIFEEITPETFGILVYQEALQKTYQILTSCPGPEAEAFRRDISKKQKAKIEKLKVGFIEKATAKIGAANAIQAWEALMTWSAYGFNKSHAVCYSVVGYGCAFAKEHFKLEWWCSVLKNASKKDVNEKFWKYVRNIVDLPDTKFSGPTFEIQNERIRAPLTLLKGVGQSAEKQLMRFAPYKDVNDFCQKIVRHQMENQHPVKKVMDSDTGKQKWVACDPQEKEQMKKGHNSLNRGVVSTFIVAGAMDSLFEKSEELTIFDKLQIFEQALSDASYVPAYTAKGKLRKRPAPKKVDQKFLSMGALERFQTRKSILPAYSEDLVPTLLARKTPKIEAGWDNDAYLVSFNERYNKEYRVRFATYKDLEENLDCSLMEGDKINFAVAAYVDSMDWWMYEGRTKEGVTMTLNVEGRSFEVCKWAGQARVLPAHLKKDWTGAVAVLSLSRFSPDRPPAIQDLVIVQEPIKKTTDENKDEEDEEEEAA